MPSLIISGRKEFFGIGKGFLIRSWKKNNTDMGGSFIDPFLFGEMLLPLSLLSGCDQQKL